MPTIPEMVVKGWGDPLASDYAAKHVKQIAYKTRTFRVRKEVAPLFEGFLLLLDRAGVDISTGPLDDWSYVVRPIRGYEDVKPTPYSYHSWALAIDLNSITNPIGSLGTTFPIRKTNRFATDCSLTWGYNWRPPSRPDPQHFEFNLKASEVPAAIAKFRQKHPDLWEQVKS